MTRLSRIFQVYLLSLLSLFAVMLVHAARTRRAAGPALREKSRLVRQLELTDLCLCTEASYTRHLSQADFHTEFQDHPVCLEHFPSGSFLEPPPHLRRMHGQLD
jgi:hypothetical protein